MAIFTFYKIWSITCEGRFLEVAGDCRWLWWSVDANVLDRKGKISRKELHVASMSSATSNWLQLDGDWVVTRQRLGATAWGLVGDQSPIAFHQWKICFDRQPFGILSQTSRRVKVNQFQTKRTICRVIPACSAIRRRPSSNQFNQFSYFQWVLNSDESLDSIVYIT